VGGSNVSGSMGYVDGARELAAQVRRGDLPEPDAFVVGPGSGGQAAGGAAGARELAARVGRGTLPDPDVCVVALGSGGTAAGLAAGFAATGLKTRVVGGCVSSPQWVVRLVALFLAFPSARRG